MVAPVLVVVDKRNKIWTLTTLGQHLMISRTLSKSWNQRRELPIWFYFCLCSILRFWKYQLDWNHQPMKLMTIGGIHQKWRMKTATLPQNIVTVSDTQNIGTARGHQERNLNEQLMWLMPMLILSGQKSEKPTNWIWSWSFLHVSSLSPKSRPADTMEAAGPRHRGWYTVGWSIQKRCGMALLHC